MENLHRILLVVAYDGTAYSGFAQQKNEAVRTIAGVLDETLAGLTGEAVQVTGGSRTDAGVHALCNYAVFDTHSPIPPEKFAPALNPLLPEDIRIRQSREVPETFHPRNVRSEKTYEYHIYNARVPDPLRRNYACFTYFHLDVAKMREGAAILVGEHDFRSFCNPASRAQSTIREITDLTITETALPVPTIMFSKKHVPAEQDLAREIVIRVTGRGFLYNMVRIIAGTLLDVGRGLREPAQVREMLEARNRQAAGPTAPPQGLVLVNYRFL